MKFPFSGGLLFFLLVAKEWVLGILLGIVRDIDIGYLLTFTHQDFCVMLTGVV